MFLVCNLRYFPWVATLSLLRYVCNFVCLIAWFLHHQNGGLKNKSAALRFWYQSICFWIWVDHCTSKLYFLSLCFGCATSDIFHGWPPYHYWDMYVIFCVPLHDFCTIKMVASKMNLQVSDFDIRVYALGFGGDHSTSKLPFFVFMFLLCNFRYFPWVASISLLR